ncbi:DUF1553 domain-containing protein [Schlesneria sp. T3-172]|uniref:DUF1553 domain-containing protein n=1 Tax=Schlesneria sphaerica TaxID=3373610 RepID=UPI0037CBE624
METESLSRSAMLAGVICSFGLFLASTAQADDGGQFFESEVRPVLVEHCQRCHGAKKQEAGLRLDSRDALLKGGDNGAAIVPGDANASLLILAVKHLGDTQMPPNGKLTDKQIAAIEHWVQAGAPWPAALETVGESLADVHRRHWAFQPVTNPAVPDVKETTWERTPIDRFVLARLEANGLSPSPAADRRTLIRRLSMDLTGLPPTPERVDAFVNDPAEDAYEKLVEELLDSPHYGEQWARHWLDVARYSDTKGYVYAREERFWVHAPAYRDWVVQAFNRDLRYDQFLLLQIAADQVAPNDLSAQAAMGFLTLGRRFLGVTHEIIDDRIDVVTRGTMGLTVACARCHDHKYDPIPTADYYSLYGVFLNSTERLQAIAEPPVRDEAYEAFDKELQKRRQQLHDTLQQKRTEASDRVRERVTDYLVAQTELSKYPEEGFDQVLAVTDVIPTFVRRWEAWLALETRIQDPIFGPWRRFAALKADEFAEQSPLIVKALNDEPALVNSKVLSALSRPPATMREVAERYGTLLQAVNRDWKLHLEKGKAAGLPDPAAFDLPEDESLRQVLFAPGSPCLVPNEPIVSTEGYFDSGSVTELWRLQGEVDRWLIQSPLAPAHAVTLVDRELIRPARIFRRGNPANRGAEVQRHFVSVVAGSEPAPFQQGSGRRELAQAIIDPQNPLTARVWVNRVWQGHFGSGLVKTSSDFGIRAEPPSHPELLDWLARQLIANEWSTKHLHRLIVLSSTYRQQSLGTDDQAPQAAGGTNTAGLARAMQVDPENRLLWRMNTRRLSFEEFRDSLLMAAGRLDLQMGGRASDLFATEGTAHRRRTLYGLIDRQFLAATLRVFDFANPDLHIPLRSETTVPQQALFALNHPFVAQQARSLVERVSQDGVTDPAEKIRRLYRTVFQRQPTPGQLERALAFLAVDGEEIAAAVSPESLAWQYGYGRYDEAAKILTNFQPLPYFNGAAWQGGTQWPDAALGWVQVTASGGHPGNNLDHCAVRRWTAPHDGTFSVESTAAHEVAAGNGIRCSIISSRQGSLASIPLHNTRQKMDIESIELKKGDSLDFVVDINGELNSDQYLWSPVVRHRSAGSEAANIPEAVWDAQRDFTGPLPSLLSNLEQLAQVLLIANELMFVD